MKFMSAGKFKARCLRVIDEVRETRESVVVTKNGKPVVKLVPADAQAKDVFGCLAGVVEIVGDTAATVARPKDWNALR